MSTNIPLDEKSRKALRLYKVLSGHNSYSESILALIEDEAGLSVPDGELDDEELLRPVFSEG